MAQVGLVEFCPKLLTVKSLLQILDLTSFLTWNVINVDGMNSEVDKKKLNQLFANLYNEAQNLEV